jgi:hypothetical protein
MVIGVSMGVGIIGYFTPSENLMIVEKMRVVMNKMNRNESAHKTPIKGKRQFMTADFGTVRDFKETAALDSRVKRFSVETDHSTGRKMWLCMAFFGILMFGCAAAPKAEPVSPYAACYAQAKEDTKSALATSMVVTADTTDKILSAMIAAEEYLQKKVQEFKVDHPELVERGEEELAVLRRKISEYKEKLSNKLSLSTH